MTRHKFFFFSKLFSAFFILFFCKSGNDFWFFIFPALNFKHNDTNFGIQFHNLSGDTTEKKFMTNFLPLNELLANEFPTQIRIL